MSVTQGRLFRSELMLAPRGGGTFNVQDRALYRIADFWRAGIISYGSDPAAPLRRPRSALPARPDFPQVKLDPLREPSGPAEARVPRPREGWLPLPRRHRTDRIAGRIAPTGRRSS